jgi:drug/metabolite transporter (DMT)-like permease
VLSDLGKLGHTQREGVMTPRTLGLLMAMTTGVCWATLAIALRQAMHFASTGTIVWFRMIVAFLILAVYYGIRDFRLLKLFWTRPLILIAGLNLSINYFAYMRGLELTSASNAQIMIQLGPLALLFVGVLYFKEHPAWSQVAGVVVAFAGFSLFFWDQIIQSFAHKSDYIIGNLWILLASVTWAIFASLQKGLKGNWTTQQFNMVIYGICTFALWPTAHLTELGNWSLPVWILMLACGLNTLLAYGAFAEALKLIPASHVSLIISVNPLLTILLVTLLSTLNLSWISTEPIGWRGLIGALLVVTGISLAVFVKPRRGRGVKTAPATL